MRGGMVFTQLGVLISQHSDFYSAYKELMFCSMALSTLSLFRILIYFNFNMLQEFSYLAIICLDDLCVSCICTNVFP